ncbi:hypothetical protein BJY01DRAFT_207149 [Aspergillus pseudoustus]|uniref:Uncharacterized protein n=1 Tax=Aspergillus pseudoustus TaxID=1810923 RepID=A0ABR4KPS1_9EURO
MAGHRVTRNEVLKRCVVAGICKSSRRRGPDKEHGRIYTSKKILRDNRALYVTSPVCGSCRKPTGVIIRNNARERWWFGSTGWISDIFERDADLKLNACTQGLGVLSDSYCRQPEARSWFCTARWRRHLAGLVKRVWILQVRIVVQGLLFPWNTWRNQ